MTDQEIQQAIDACRPGSDDLQRPEMAALAEAVRRDPEVRRRYERSQQFDASVSGAVSRRARTRRIGRSFAGRRRALVGSGDRGIAGAGRAAIIGSRCPK